MEKNERLAEAIAYLKSHNYAKTQKEVAERMQSTPANVSNALKGVPTVLTNSFLYRFNEAYGNIFQTEWLLDGEGSMLSDITQGGMRAADSLMTAPVIPETVTKRPDTDILEYARMGGARLERSQVALADNSVALWYRVEDDALAPRICKGDLVGLASEGDGMCKIIPGRVYAVNGKSIGIALRVMREHPDGLLAVASNPSYNDFTIANEDIIRVFRVVCMATFNV